ncbi:hypothetical protein [Desertivirga brevis]|uniref:hypothetical protein n=1 Tax=Desertivirga brevis TaxID=2810310 RepID=UPI001A96EF41|nr:hypothetical protein [Pedobacter sp. SYSU D00873]
MQENIKNAVCSCYAKKGGNKTNGPELKSLLVSLVKQRGLLIDNNQLIYSVKDDFTILQLLHTLLLKGDRAVMVSKVDDLYHRLLVNLKRKVSFTGSDDAGMITANLEQICLQGDVKLVFGAEQG